ncbi:MFS transporter [Corynebacterium amycolatum]|uniref:MFS transporter n=1 Tax=Corynebacterium amycolatum TaxID=43765 RepID=UPI000185C023|nr:MFS transporter [Corynebacterium amycolatum]EEB64323.1 transporter, major facilitator family protein [Corynebacterium amycolatum SK46]
MPAYRHLILLLSMFAAVGSSVVHMGVPFLIPSLQENGLSLSAAGLIAAMPAAGIVFTLIAWGWFVDRYGERAALFAGLTSTALTTGLAALASSSSPALLGATLFLSGCAAASVNSASGRVVSGWYPPHQRGTAMGIRQMAQPLGAALSAVTLHPLAQNYSIGVALAMPAILCAVLALLVLVGVKNPPRPDASSPTVTASPYRDGKYLVRIHIASALLSWPQSMMGAYILVWLLSVGYADGTAGTIVMVSQLLGAGSRALMGVVSDRVRSRIRPYRWVSGATFILAVAMMIASWADWRTLGTVLVCALAVAVVSPNGLAFTAVAEYAGPFWSGRAMGTQNTFQNIIYAATPPVSGAIVAAAGFPALFAVTALFPAAALGIAPREDQNRHGRVELG